RSDPAWRDGQIRNSDRAGAQFAARESRWQYARGEPRLRCRAPPARQDRRAQAPRGNAGLIHRGEPHLIKIGEPRQRVIPAHGWQVDNGWIPVLNEIGAEEMLLKRNLFDHASSSVASREASGPPLSVPHNGYSVQTAVLGRANKMKWRSSVTKT